MGTIVVQEMVTADGFFSGPNGETDWFVTSEDLNTYSLEIINTVDAILYGAQTYRMMVDFWPEPPAEFVARSETLRMFVQRTNEIRKLVVSRSTIKPWGNWNNAEALTGTVEDKARKIKTSEQAVIVYGSGSIVRQLTDLGLVDEYRLIVNPVVLGEGVPLFSGGRHVALELVDSKRLSSGALANTYTPSRSSQ